MRECRNMCGVCVWCVGMNACVYVSVCLCVCIYTCTRIEEFLNILPQTHIRSKNVLTYLLLLWVLSKSSSWVPSWLSETRLSDSGSQNQTEDPGPVNEALPPPMAARQLCINKVS